MNMGKVLRTGGDLPPARLAKAQGLFNLASGVWPLVSMGTFERITGPKVDRWLVQTVSGLLITNGLTQLTADASSQSLRLARCVGQGTAGTLAVIDLVYAPRGRIRKVFLVDAVVELVWIVLWNRAGRRGSQSG